jgi:hypothetical protein
MRVQVGGGGHLDGGGADNHRLIIAKDGLVPLLQRAVSRERFDDLFCASSIPRPPCPFKESIKNPVRPHARLKKWGYVAPFLEMKMARANLGSISVEALLELRDEIGKVLTQRAV